MISFRTKKFDDEIWDIGKLITLLRKEVLAKERSFAIGACFNDCNGNDEKFNFSPSALFPQSKNSSKHRCVFCNKSNHASNKCLKTSEPIVRKEIAKQKRSCFLCLEKVHSAVSCRLKRPCNKCGGKHNIAICTFSKDETNPSPPVSTEDAETSTNLSTNKNNILFQTASVSVCCVDNNKLDNVPLLFDYGSQQSYVSDKLRKQLKLPTLRSEKISVNTFGNKESVTKMIDVVPLKFVLKDKIIQIECLCTTIL